MQRTRMTTAVNVNYDIRGVNKLVIIVEDNFNRQNALYGMPFIE